MPMNGAQLAGEVLRAIGGEPTPDRVRAFTAMCEAIVAHIQANAVVTVPSVTGVLPGGGVSGPGTGTIQ